MTSSDAAERATYEQEHPRRILALHTRSRLLGTLNIAIAVGGRSTGWGRPGKPRRTFIGRHRTATAPYHRGIELTWGNSRGPRDKVLLRVPLGSGIAATRRWRPTNG